MDCLTCKYARRACNEEYVGCAHWTEENGREYNPMSLDSIMEELGVSTLAQGWAYLGRYPEQSNAPDVTVNANMMTNGVICFKKDYVCKAYQSRS